MYCKPTRTAQSQLIASAAWAGLCLGLAAAGAGGILGDAGARQPRPEVHVAAAVSLTEALQQLAAAFEGEQGVKVVLNLAASHVLARQIATGAPADVFVSADEAQMDVIAAVGQIVRRVDLVGNELVVVVPAGSRRTVAGPRDLLKPEISRVAIGDPAGVPAGVYAKRYLERAGVWSALAPKLVPAASVRAALAALEAGNVDAAIVYRTDTTLATRVRVAYHVRGPDAPRIVYPAALLSRAGDATRFFDFLRSDRAGVVFARLGFTPLTAVR